MEVAIAIAIAFGVCLLLARNPNLNGAADAARSRYEREMDAWYSSPPGTPQPQSPNRKRRATKRRKSARK